eukprot:CAMPEP_0113883936 /NCGR_PEP_ID=MMETSP0780_2-20120614/9918_1 /TAXON_ID=652834 /ORGANISM="Palpitomonas bilix" /LENGTH=68 /DNA_ID=CAMNT_0000871379 /DNA_START=104 /DNA_END=310 /DNA_ORIENTATION=+ /assembly_acc=CAM_ASM_000599
MPTALQSLANALDKRSKLAADFELVDSNRRGGLDKGQKGSMKKDISSSAFSDALKSAKKVGQPVRKGV